MLGREIRLGHALRFSWDEQQDLLTRVGDDLGLRMLEERSGEAFPRGESLLRIVFGLLEGRVALPARAPADVSVVVGAEACLGVRAGARPIYAYVGLFHPHLGGAGLVVSPCWCDEGGRLEGVTRCDSGGMWGGHGGFGVLAPEEREGALLGVSFVDGVEGWREAFAGELAGSYAGPDPAWAYVSGQAPDVSGWGEDGRAECVRRAAAPRDRRLWTWELRLRGAPSVGELVGVLVDGVEMGLWLALESEREGEVLERVTVLSFDLDDRGDVSAGSVEAVARLFLGR